MIYPKKISSKKVNTFINIFRLNIVCLSIFLLVINYFTTPQIYWSHFCIIGTGYVYFTVRYSISRNKNIASYVAIQTVLLFILMYLIDYRIGYRGWSINIAFPILIIISNITMFIITIINYKNYGKYAISQLIIVLLSFSIIYYIYNGYVKLNVLNCISIMISIFNFLFSLVLCHRDFKEEIIRRISI